jgi:hypothetical protein
VAFPLEDGIEEALVLLSVQFVVLEDLEEPLLLPLQLCGRGVGQRLLLLHLLHQVLQHLLYNWESSVDVS